MKFFMCVLFFASTCRDTFLANVKKASPDEATNNHLDVIDRHHYKPTTLAYPRSHSFPSMTSRLRQEDRCLFKPCYPGERCVVDGLSGKATCVCKKHCRAVDKPLCGTDGEYYINRCEMHKAACLAGDRVYDARHKDCFYKRSICDVNDLKLFEDFLLQYHQSSTTMTRHNEVNRSETKTPSRTKRDANLRSHHHKKQSNNNLVTLTETDVDHVVTKLTDPSGTSDDVTANVKSETLTTSFITTTSIASIPQAHSNFENFNDDIISDVTSHQSIGTDTALLSDNIISSDVRGETVKELFRFFDLDVDGRVGSEEIYEMSLMEDLDSILPPPCSLYHLLHYGDYNKDGFLDIQELFKLYNITILRLPNEDRIVHGRAVYGDSFTIECGIQGETRPKWRRHGHDVASDKDIQVATSRLRFTEIHPRHAGHYTCHARTHTDIFQIHMISVISQPAVKVYPSIQHRLEGSSVTIRCHVSGVPSPRITWLLDGEPLKEGNGRFLFMGNNTELHINEAKMTDSAAYTCLGTNPAGENEEVATVIVHSDVTNNQEEVPSSGTESKSSYFVFHENGITIVEARACMVVRSIAATEPVPGLLRQNKLCKASSSDGKRKCKWSEAVAVGLRFVYAAQPEENRIVVVDLLLQRVLEVIATDALPVSLHYVPSTDQVFVHCWVDASRERSSLQVIHAAGVLGAHAAFQIQPLDGGKAIDQSVMNFFVPREGTMNARSQYGFVSHHGQQLIYKLNLATLLFDEDVIDLRAHDCVPKRFTYQPIGGRLDVTCENVDGGIQRSVTVECASNRVFSEGDGFDQEFVSLDSRHVVRVEPSNQRIRLFNVTEWGDLVDSIELHTNFRVSDVTFEPKLSNTDSSTVYISSQLQGDIMYLDPSSGIVQVIGGLPQPVDQSQAIWPILDRPLMASSWYDRHLATSGESQFVIIDVDTNDVTCRLNDMKEASAIVWVDGPL